MIKSGHMVLKGVNWVHSTKIRLYGLQRSHLGAQYKIILYGLKRSQLCTQYKNQLIWS